MALAEYGARNGQAFIESGSIVDASSERRCNRTVVEGTNAQSSAYEVGANSFLQRVGGFAVTFLLSSAHDNTLQNVESLLPFAST